MNRKLKTKAIADALPAPTAKPPFQIGDTVKLNSGSPNMTVIGVKADAISLCWYSDHAGAYTSLSTAILPSGVLTLVALNPNRVN